VRVLIDYRPALRERTGVGEYAHEMAKALVRRQAAGDSLTLFSSSWKDRLNQDAVPGAQVADSRIPVRILNLAWHRLGWPPVETLVGPIDVAHAFHPLMIPTSHAAQVVTIHDLYFLDEPDHTTAEIRWDYAELARPHANRADAVIVNSNYTAGQVISRLNVPAERITVCYPGAPAWLPLGPRSTAGPIVFVGTIEPRKNVGALLQASARLFARKADAPPLVLAGRVAPACQGLLDEIRRGPLAGRVRHLGYVTDQERQALYRDASMLVLPSREEGFGIPALEAMALGVPVVASARGALPEVVGDAGLLVEPDDIDGLAAAMERLLTDEALARGCSERGTLRARQFNWNMSAARLAEAYRSAIERRRDRT
jgi:glycosyltransferase involved in cell wall biosynthesis